MALAHITETGNVSIPKIWRDELGIVPNSKVIIEKRGREIVIEPLKKSDLKSIMAKIDEEVKKKKISFSRAESLRDDLYD